MSQDAHGTCTKCGADWDGGPIPQQHHQHYSPHFRWSRRIYIVDRDRDRGVAWKCPDCGDEQPIKLESAI